MDQHYFTMAYLPVLAAPGIEPGPFPQVEPGWCRGPEAVQHPRPGIMHRDIKPHNVLLQSSDSARMALFGLSLRQQVARRRQTAATPLSGLRPGPAQ